jgi:beta-lactamase regulating signal transducer with metallopeptidase domain
MGIGVSLILVAAGAILTWAVNATVSGLNIHTVGVILLIIGLVGLVLSMLFWSSIGSAGFARRQTTVVDDGVGPTRYDRVDVA